LAIYFKNSVRNKGCFFEDSKGNNRAFVLKTGFDGMMRFCPKPENTEKGMAY
jgi:hypothetical protein